MNTLNAVRSSWQRPKTLEQVFHANHMPVPESGCWLWLGSTAHFGHGQIYAAGRNVKAHRISWEIHRGAIPARMQVNHKCDVPSCVNPNHLYLGTQAENMRDKKVRKRAANANTTHCINGHEYTMQSTYLLRNGDGFKRVCRQCRTNRMRDYAREKKQ